jgi:hypothetical protein
MRIKNIVINILTAAGAFSTALFIMKKRADKKDLLRRMMPASIAPRPGEIRSSLSPDYLRFGGLE